MHRQAVRDMEREIEMGKTYKFMDSIKRERDKNMKKLYAFMNKNKKNPSRRNLALRMNKGIGFLKRKTLKDNYENNGKKFLIQDVGQPPSWTTFIQN